MALEEPDICTLSIAPGAVDTEMQRELREVHSAVMAEEDKTFFQNIHKEGKLLKPEQPGNVFARIVLAPPFELSGKSMRYWIPFARFYGRTCLPGLDGTTKTCWERSMTNEGLTWRRDVSILLSGWKTLAGATCR